MELAASVRPYLSLTAAFLEPSEHLSSLATDRPSTSEAIAPSLGSGPSDPRVSSVLDTVQNGGLDATWRIDGIGGLGRRYYVVPLSEGMPLYPTGINLVIPDQAKHSDAIRGRLHTLSTFYTQGVDDQPLIDYLCQLLTRWQAAEGSRLETVYKALPLGSSLILEDLTPLSHGPMIRLHPASEIEEGLLTVKELKARWSDSEVRWPDILQLEAVELVRRISYCVSVATLPAVSGDRPWIFKSKITNPMDLYHEMKVLINMTPHPTVTLPPIYFVTKKVHGVDKVCGFIMEYYEGGPLGLAIQQKKSEGKLDLSLQLKWGIQLTSGLQHIYSSNIGFFSTLKPDNVVCAEGDRLVLIDFEQNGNWATFAAPEIGELASLGWLCKSPYVPADVQEHYKRLAVKHFGQDWPAREAHWRIPSSAEYPGWPDSFYRDWDVLPRDLQESAMVYSLGKLLWCIFEGWSHTMNGIDEDYQTPCEWEFPEFRTAPLSIQELILQCTAGDPAIHGTPTGRIVRVGDKAYPFGQSGQGSEPKATDAETLVVAKQIALRRIERMERFLDAKWRYQQKEDSSEDRSFLGFPQRPKLSHVLEVLQKEQLLLAERD